MFSSFLPSFLLRFLAQLLLIRFLSGEGHCISPPPTPHTSCPHSSFLFGARGVALTPIPPIREAGATAARGKKTLRPTVVAEVVSAENERQPPDVRCCMLEFFCTVPLSCSLRVPSPSWQHEGKQSWRTGLSKRLTFTAVAVEGRERRFEF